MELLNNGYTNHLDATAAHPVTGEVFIAYNETVPGPDRKNLRNVKIIRRAPDGSRTLVKEYREHENGITGPLGYTGLTLLPTGDLLVTLSLGSVEGEATVVRAALDIIPRVAQPWPLMKTTTPSPAAPVKLNPPVGFDPYGGTSKSYQPSADGAHFFTQCGKGPQGFGQYVFRQVGNNRAEYVTYGPLMTGRGGFDLSGDGRLYVTASKDDSDELAWAFPVPGYVPFTNSVTVYNSGSAGGNVDLSAIEARIAAVETQVRQAKETADYAAQRANYVKGIYEPVWGRLDALESRPVGITRDEAWQLAADRAFVEVSNPQSGVAGAILALVRPLVGEQSTGSGPAVDNEARAKADEALQRAQEAKNLAMSAVDTLSTLAQAIQAGIDRWFERSVRYEDKRLLNLIWDRGVKLLRYKESTGKTAAQLPVNDQNNLSV